MANNVIIIGSGLGGLSTALRLSSLGYKIRIIEKENNSGGRVNIIKKDRFKFDMGPSFMSMTYELEELFKATNFPETIRLKELNPLYQVFFEGKENPRIIWKDLSRLEREFADVERNFKNKTERYLKRGGNFFHDTENKVVKKNFDSLTEYLITLASVPWKHVPYLMKSMWSEISKTFDSDEARVIFSLVAFFLGDTPFHTPAIYSLLSYTEMKHNGYWFIEGGIYSLIEKIETVLRSRDVEFCFDTEITDVIAEEGKVIAVVDNHGKQYKGDIFISNSDAASFRGKVLKRKEFKEAKLDKLHWTLAPFSIYLGVKGNIDNLMLHNYFLGNNFKGYADKIFTSSISPQKPYYYVNNLSKRDSTSAPEGYESLYILCPVPDLRFKSNWDDKEELANNIIEDLGKRIKFDLKKNIVSQTIMTPKDWEEKFNLYKGSGLGLAHDISQVGYFRPKNKDEKLENLYYVGASTTPGTGLPMVIISSKLVTERIRNDYGTLQKNDLQNERNAYQSV